MKSDLTGKNDNDYYSSSTLLKTQFSNEQNYESSSEFKSEDNLPLNESRKTIYKSVNDKQLIEKQDKENKLDSRK